MTIIAFAVPAGKAAGPAVVRPRPDDSPEGPEGGPGGFPRVPHKVFRDWRLSPTARIVACALESVAYNQPTCWPSNRTLGSYVGPDRDHARRRREAGDPLTDAELLAETTTITRCLKELAACGHIRIMTVSKSVNPTGRVIYLTWNECPQTLSDGATAAPPGTGVDAGTRSDRSWRRRRDGTGVDAGTVPASTQDELELEDSGKKDVTLRDETPTVSGRESEKSEASAVAGPALSLGERVACLAGASPEDVDTLAHWIATDLGDLSSVGGYRAKVGEVVRGAAPVVRLEAALKAGLAARSDPNVRRPGSLFMSGWAAWKPRATEAEAAARREAERAAMSAMPVGDLLAVVRSEYGRDVRLNAAGDGLDVKITPNSRQPDGHMAQVWNARTSEMVAILRAGRESPAGAGELPGPRDPDNVNGFGPEVANGDRGVRADAGREGPGWARTAVAGAAVHAVQSFDRPDPTRVAAGASSESKWSGDAGPGGPGLATILPGPGGAEDDATIDRWAAGGDRVLRRLASQVLAGLTPRRAVTPAPERGGAAAEPTREDRSEVVSREVSSGTCRAERREGYPVPGVPPGRRARSRFRERHGLATGPGHNPQDVLDRLTGRRPADGQLDRVAGGLIRA